VGRRQSLLGTEVSAPLQEGHWGQPEVAEVSSERERKEKSTKAGLGKRLCWKLWHRREESAWLSSKKQKVMFLHDLF